jgi:hypothetical protein
MPHNDKRFLLNIQICNYQMRESVMQGFEELDLAREEVVKLLVPFDDPGGGFVPQLIPGAKQSLQHSAFRKYHPYCNSKATSHVSVRDLQATDIGLPKNLRPIFG